MVVSRHFFSLVAVAAMIAGCSKPEPAPATSNAAPSKGAAASRISVKHGNDPDAKDINTTPKDISVEDLIAQKMPEDAKSLENYSDSRVGDFERTTFRVKGTLKSIVHRKDGDYYLEMEGPTGAKAVIEVPDPKLCEGSPILPQITAARDELEKKYHPTDTRKEVNEPATIEGVGFYGWKGKPGSGGTGRAPRLMPGTGFKSGKG